MMFFDDSLLNKVIRNIVLNAREAMPEGGMVSVNAENVILNPPSDLPLPGGDYVRVSIADQGKVSRRKSCQRSLILIFRPNNGGGQKGMGLGLTICYSVVQKHGGAITIDSNTGQGMTIQIYLPALRKGMEEERPARDVITGRGRILVMDDEEMVRKMTGAILSPSGI